MQLFPGQIYYLARLGVQQEDALYIPEYRRYIYVQFNFLHGIFAKKSFIV